MRNPFDLSDIPADMLAPEARSATAGLCWLALAGLVVVGLFGVYVLVGTVGRWIFAGAMGT